MQLPKSGIYTDITDSYLRPFTMLFGGRGVGKTYSLLLHRIEDSLKNDNHKFIWLRDTEAVTNKIASGESITAPIEKNHPEIGTTQILKYKGNYHFINAKGTDKEKTLGYLMALSTFHNARGLSYEDVAYIIFDEFMPEEGTIIKKGQGILFLNMYESINRNRELAGLDPVKVIFLSNTNCLYSEIIEDLGLAGVIETLQQENKTTFLDNDVWIEFIENNEFLEAKKNTLLYRLSTNAKFNDMALNNRFTDNLALIVPKANLKGSKGLLTLDFRYTLIQLNNGQLYFKLGSWKNLINYDMDNDQEALLYKFMFADKLRYEYIAGNMFFDSIYTQRRVLSYAKF